MHASFWAGCEDGTWIMIATGCNGMGRIISASNSVPLECNIINYPTSLDNQKFKCFQASFASLDI